MLKFSDIPEEMQTKAQEWAIDEALSAVFSDYEGGGYEVIKIVEESKSKNIYFFTWCY